MPRRPLSARRSNPAARTMALRQWHTYIGAFIAPSVLFFALTGAIQLFSLHEAHDGYKPPVLIEKLASVHKDQVFRARKQRQGGPPSAAPKPAGDGGGAGISAKAEAPKAKPFTSAQIRTWALKWVFVLVALGLIVSTVLGLWMAFTTGKRTGASFYWCCSWGRRFRCCSWRSETGGSPPAGSPVQSFRSPSIWRMPSEIETKGDR